MSSRKLYGTRMSGNVYKVRLLLSLLNLPYEFVTVDLATQEHRSPSFLRINPLGQVPVLVDSGSAGEIHIRDSQAILVYLARQYGGDWLPNDAVGMAKVMQWLSIAANEIEHSVTALRRHFLLGLSIDKAKAERTATRLLKIMDEHLQTQQWLECDRPTVADIACFPYLACAEDSQLNLTPYANVVAWLDRVRSLPGYICL